MAMSPASTMPASSRAKCASADVQLDVDEIMLEYLVYMAAKAVIAERKAQRRYRNASEAATSASDMPLNLVNSFLPLFNANYPSHTISEASQFRLRLLQFSTLFTQRLWPLHSTPPTSSLEQLRHRNRTRANTWLWHHWTPGNAQDLRAYDNDSELPFPQDVLSHHRSSILAQHFSANSKDLEEEGHFYGTPASVSLRDTLPAFMELSAHMTASFQSGSVTDTWIQFAGQYMLQAALEAYLVYGESGDEALRECFAWGFDPEASPETEGEDSIMVNAMFYDDDEAVRERWMQAREGFLRILTPPFVSQDVHLQEHLEDVARRYPLANFEGLVLKFLKALIDCNEPPVLAQLETGSLAGFSREEAAGLSSILGIRIN